MKVNLVKNEPNRIETKADFAPLKEEVSIENIEMLTVSSEEEKREKSRIIPIKLRPEEAKRAYEYQKTMLNFAYLQYKKSIGTKQESSMQKLYKEALGDYNFFVSVYEEDISN